MPGELIDNDALLIRPVSSPEETIVIAPTTTLMTADQVSAVFGVTARTIYNWAEAGLLPTVRIGRTRRFHPRDVAALIDARREPMATSRDGHGEASSVGRSPAARYASIDTAT